MPDPFPLLGVGSGHKTLHCADSEVGGVSSGMRMGGAGLSVQKITLSNANVSQYKVTILYNVHVYLYTKLYRPYRL